MTMVHVVAFGYTNLHDIIQPNVQLALCWKY